MILLLIALTWSFCECFNVFSISRLMISPTSRALTSTSAVAPFNGGVKVDESIILFDGVCNFCNKWVDIIMSLDRNKKYKYCALQSTEGKDYLCSIGKESTDISTVVFITDQSKARVAYFKSDVLIAVLDGLGPPWSFLAKVASVVPRSLRDAIYDFVAKNRYSIMGKRDICRCANIVDS